MERAALEQVRQKVEEEVRERFPGGAVQRVTVLQYGDEPVIEPGELLVRVHIESGGGRKDREQAIRSFEDAHGEAIEKFRTDLSAKLPEARRLEFLAGDDSSRGPRMVLRTGGGSLEARALAGSELTPVMARLGPVDLETLDTLITAGIAPNRAEGVRWALARIRERPAYARLLERAREIDELKTQF